MRTFAVVFAGGALGLVVLKLLFGLVMPLFSLLIGLVTLTVKVAFFAAVAYFIYSLVRGRRREQEGPI